MARKNNSVIGWTSIFHWYETEGYQNVAAYLSQLDISEFDPKAPPPHTQAFWAIVDANRSPEDADLADVLEEIGKIKNEIPIKAITLEMVTRQAIGDFHDWLKDRKNRRNIPHRLETACYLPVRNPDADDGLWKIVGKRQAVYAHASLSVADRIKAARALASQSSQ